MPAVRYYAPGEIRIGEVPTPEASSGGLRVRVDACAATHHWGWRLLTVEAIAGRVVLISGK